MKVYSASSVREMDRRAIEELGVQSLTLMEKAGQAIADAAKEMLGPGWTMPVVCLAGPGNNGGDAFVAARLLRADGVAVRVFLAADGKRLSPDAAANEARLKESGIVVESVEMEVLSSALAGASLIIDGIFGSGFRGEPEGEAAAAISVVARSRKRVLAIDVPSGVEADTGRCASVHIRAARTVSLAEAKTGNVIGPGGVANGELSIADIGLPESAGRGIEPVLELHGDVWRGEWPVPPGEKHKGNSGRLLVIGGSAGMVGAPSLAAEAAMRADAGSVVLAVPASLEGQARSICGAEIMLRGLPEGRAGTISTEAAEEALKMAQAFDAVVVGPGLGRTEECRHLVKRVASGLKRPLLLDADALWALTDALSSIGRFKRASDELLMTPHVGELSFLTGEKREDIDASRLRSAEAAAQAGGCTILLKGARTIIATTGRMTNANGTGNRGLATAGSGDVLAGIAGALLAKGMPAHNAGVLAAWLHGMAAEIAVEGRRPEGMIASDVIGRLPLAIDRFCSGNEGEVS